MDINPVEERPGDLAHVAYDLTGIAAARLAGIRKKSARAGVHNFVYVG